MLHIAEFIAALALVLSGVALAFIPMMPAIPFMFLVSLAYGFVDGWTTLTANETLVLLGFAVASLVVDQVSGVFGAKLGGAHAKSILWGMAGGILGTVFLPAFGSFIGLFGGVLAAEIYYKKKRGEALKAASGALVGSVAGMAVNIALALAFAACFFFFALK